MGLFTELRRRNVFRVAGVYAVVGWLVLQVASLMETAIGLPEWFDGLVFALVVIGMPMALVFAWAFELTPEGLKRSSDVASEDSIASQTGARLNALLIVALLVFAIANVAPYLLGGREEAEKETPIADVVPVADGLQTESFPAAASLAVLPFVDLSSAGDKEYFADGISEELLNVLAKVRELRVAGRTSSFAFKGQNQDLREIGEALNVAHLLEGSVRSQGERVRVTAQLISVADGFHLWSETYDRELTDIFAVQDDIAQKILAALREPLGVGVPPEVVKAVPTDPVAYDKFLAAQGLLAARNVESMSRAIELLTEAIDIDPRYAPAWVLRGKTRYLNERYRTAILSDSATALIEADLAMAVEVAGMSAESMELRGLLEMHRANPGLAIDAYQQALAINPNLRDARNWLATTLSSVGREAEAYEQRKQLVALDPLYYSGVANFIMLAAQNGDQALAQQVAERYENSIRDEQSRLAIRARYAIEVEGCGAAVQLMRQIDLSKLSTSNRVNLGRCAWTLGFLKEGAAAAEGAPRIAPYVALDLGRFDEAVQLATEMYEQASRSLYARETYAQILFEARADEQLYKTLRELMDGEQPIQNLALISITGALADEAGDLVTASELRERGLALVASADEQPWRGLLWGHCLLGSADDCLKAIELGIEREELVPWETFVWRMFDPVRLDPRFIALRDRNLEAINQRREAIGARRIEQDFYEDRFNSFIFSWTDEGREVK